MFLLYQLGCRVNIHSTELLDVSRTQGTRCPTTLRTISVCFFHPACHLLVCAWAKICFDNEHQRLILEPTLAKIRACETRGQQVTHKSSATVLLRHSIVLHLSCSVEPNQEFISPISLVQGGHGPPALRKGDDLTPPALFLLASLFILYFCSICYLIENSSDKTFSVR